MAALIDVILPVFLVIGFGYAVTALGRFHDHAVEGLMRFAQTFALPCVLFRGVAKLDLATVYDPGLLLSFYLAAFASFGLGALAARLAFGRSPEDSIAIGFCCLFSNSLLIGLPLMERAYGPDSLAGNYAIISIHAPMFYAFGITAMELVRHRGSGLAGMQIARQIAAGILRNPLVIGIMLGFLVNVAGDPLPAAFWSGVDMMAQAALPAALFGLGGVLHRYRPEGDARVIAMITSFSLLLHPGLAWLLGTQVFALTNGQIRSVIVTAAMAPGVNAYLFANMYGTAKRVAASSVLVATAASILTTWFWLSVLP
jgi:malonate transporter and related proteins